MGLLASLLSAVFSSAKDVVSKRLAFHLHGTVSTFASFAFALPYYLLVLAILFVVEQETFTWSLPFLGLLLMRSLTDTVAEWMKMHAFAHGDLSLVACFFSLSPLFLLVTSPLITGDPLSLEEVLAVVLVVGGSLVLVYRPSSVSWAAQKKGILLATGAAVFFSLNSCFDRLAVTQKTPAVAGSTSAQVTKTSEGAPEPLPERPMAKFTKAVVAGFTMTLLSALFLLPVMVHSKVARAALHTHQGGLWVRGFLEVAFMVCKLYALQLLNAPDVVGVQRLSLLLTILWGGVFFKEKDFGRRLAAGVLLLGGVFLIAWARGSPP